MLSLSRREPVTHHEQSRYTVVRFQVRSTGCLRRPLAMSGTIPVDATVRIPAQPLIEIKNNAAEGQAHDRSRSALAAVVLMLAARSRRVRSTRAIRLRVTWVSRWASQAPPGIYLGYLGWLSR